MKMKLLVTTLFVLTAVFCGATGYGLRGHATITEVKYIDRWHEPIQTQVWLPPVTLIEVVETTTVIKETEVVRLPDAPQHDPSSVKQFADVLDSSMAVRLFSFYDDPVPDCDNYARQAQHYAASQGIILSWDSVTTERYEQIFGIGHRLLEPGREHAIVQATIDNIIWYADYFFRVYREDGTLHKDDVWLIKEWGPVD